jgi:hypothetical protein
LSAAGLRHVEPARRAECALDEVTSQRSRWYRENRRPRALSAREALAAVHFECLLLWAYGKSLLTGHEPTEEDEARVTIAMERIEELTNEAIQ